MPDIIYFDLASNESKFQYISPIAVDTDADIDDRIVMEFGGIENYSFIRMRQKKDDSFILEVEETLVKPEM